MPQVWQAVLQAMEPPLFKLDLLKICLFIELTLRLGLSWDCRLSHSSAV